MNRNGRTEAEQRSLDKRTRREEVKKGNKCNRKSFENNSFRIDQILRSDIYFIVKEVYISICAPMQPKAYYFPIISGASTRKQYSTHTISLVQVYIQLSNTHATYPRTRVGASSCAHPSSQPCASMCACTCKFVHLHIPFSNYMTNISCLPCSTGIN